MPLGAAASQVGPDALSLATLLNKDVGIPLGKTTKSSWPSLWPEADAGRPEPSVGTHGRQVRTNLPGSPPPGSSQCQRHHGRIGLERCGGWLWWLWAAVTEDTTVYGIMPGRGYDEAARLLGADFHGFLVHDGWSVYYKFLAAFHQTCTRHLINRCNGMLESASPAAAAFPDNVKAILLKGLDLRDRYLEGKVSDQGLASATGRLEADMGRLLAPSYRSEKNRRLAKHLNHEFEYLFTYLKCPGLEATNYRGEQAIRPAVVARKVWGGNRTQNGAHTQEVLTSVLRTSHQRGIDPLPNLAALLRAPRPYVLKFDSLHPARC